MSCCSFTCWVLTVASAVMHYFGFAAYGLCVAAFGLVRLRLVAVFWFDGHTFLVLLFGSSDSSLHVHFVVVLLVVMVFVPWICWFLELFVSFELVVWM